MNPLPPQAYTKETLSRAFAWLQLQPENIKELASSPDILVSLFLKAKLNGEGALERPSIQNFKSELKSLAGMMGEFDIRENTQAQSSPPQQLHSAAPSVLPASTSNPQQVSSQNSVLDSRSQEMIRKVKDQFNLSNEEEALRLLISVGFRSLENL